MVELRKGRCCSRVWVLCWCRFGAAHDGQGLVVPVDSSISVDASNAATAPTLQAPKGAEIFHHHLCTLFFTHTSRYLIHRSIFFNI